MRVLLCLALGLAVTALHAAPPHPILFADDADFAALRECCKKDELAALTRKKILSTADRYIATPPAPIIFKGRRMQTGGAVVRIHYLSMAYQLTREQKYAKRAIAEMRAGVEMNKDWNPSHFLDTAMMTLGMATGYDWCYDALTPEDRELILKGIYEKGLLPSEKHNHWVNINNNWGQVCHAGILAGALLFREKDPALTKRFVQRCITGLPHSMKAFAPNGGYPEGPLYWNYGMQFNVVAIELLERMEGTDHGLTKMPGFEQTGDYLNQMTGPSGEFFDYADAAPRRGTSCASWWFAKRYNRPDIVAYYEVDALRRAGENDYGDNQMFYPFSLLWYRPVPANTPIRSPLQWSPGGENAVTVQRTSWDNKTATYVGMKAGTPVANHGQMDCGSFVLDMMGVRWSHDLEREDYNRIESRKMNLWNPDQGSERWKIFRLNSHGHGVLMLNDEQMYVKGHAKVLEAKQTDKGFITVIDLTECYPMAQKVVRTGDLSMDGSFTVRDEIVAPAGTKVKWQMLTKASIAVCNDKVGLGENGKNIMLTPTHSFPTVWKFASSEELIQDWDSPNPGIKVLSFETVVPASGKLDLCVRFTKESDK